MTDTTWWETLVETALLGTERRTFDARLPTELQVSEAALSPERALLQTAALAANYLRAGAEPLTIALPDHSVTQPETKPYAPARAMQLLTKILDEPTPNRRLLYLWLSRCAEREWIIPANKLPALLDLNAKLIYSDCYDLLRVAVGERGRWLSGFNKEWDFITPDDLEALWQEGDSTDRQFALRQLRQTDPANALTLLRAVWPSEAAKDRVKWMSILAETATATDEPFANDVLAELNAVKKPTATQRDLRTQTVALLLAIPASALFRQTQETLAQYVTTKRELLINKVKVLLLPKEPDAFFNEKTMSTYGFETDVALTDAKQIKPWFYQLLATLHPSCWTIVFAVDYERVVEELKRQEWFKGEAIVNFAKAIIRYRTESVAKELFGSVMGHQRAQLLGLLPHSIREKRLTGSDDLSNNLEHYAHLTDIGATAWSLDFSQWAVQALAHTIQKQYQLHPVQRLFLADAVLMLHPDVGLARLADETTTAENNATAYAQSMVRTQVVEPLTRWLKLRQQLNEL